MASVIDLPLEADIQIQLVEYLSFFTLSRGFLFFSVPNEAMGKSHGRGGHARMARFKRMGLQSGVADIVLVKDGQAFFLEMKRPGCKQSVSQLEFEAQAIRAGASYSVAHSFYDALIILKNWKIIA